MPPAFGDEMLTRFDPEVREHVQAGLQAVPGLRLQDRVGHLGEVVDVLAEHLTVLTDEFACGGEQLVEILQRVGELVVAVGEGVGERRKIVVQRDELLIALVERVDEQRQALHDAEEVAAALVERVQRLRQTVEGLVELLAFSGEPGGRGFDDVAERALRLLRCRAEVGEDPVQRVAQLVVLHRHLRAIERDDGVVLHHRSARIGRRQLDVARRHQARVQDRGGGVGRDLVLVLVVERHLHLVAGGLDRVDRADPARP